jgi:alkylation response protein AidB-like acyl-CoA dehydrogenase
VLALLTEEQSMLKETAGALARAHGVANPNDLDTVDRARTWQELADAGLLGLRAGDGATEPAASGVEAMLVVEELAATLAPVPYLGSAVMATELLRLADAPPEWSEGMEEGTSRTTVVLTSDLAGLVHADDVAQGVAFDAQDASHALCLGGTAAAPEVVRLDVGSFEVLDAADMTRHLSRVAAAGTSSSVPIEPVLLDRWLAMSLVGASADIVGAMRGALEGVVEYSKEREQFGVAIGSFQAVQHLCAEALVSTQAARSMTNYAAWAVDELDAEEALLAARAAKAYASRTARPVCETAMQVYGGIGQTWENICHVYLRRALTDRKLLGDDDAQLDAIADMRLA